MKLRIIPLGTSAGRPTLARGASALAVAAEGAWVLCDCGEGAQIAALRAGLSLSRLTACRACSARWASRAASARW